MIHDRSLDGLRWSVRPGRSIRGVVVDAGDADPLEPRLEVAVVRRGGPAARAGLRPGDVITSVDGHDVRGGGAHLYGALTRVGPGVALRLGLERGATVELRAGSPP